MTDLNEIERFENEGGPPEGAELIPVRVSRELFDSLGASGVEWGEPDEEGFYTPTVTVEEDPADEMEPEYYEPAVLQGNPEPLEGTDNESS